MDLSSIDLSKVTEKAIDMATTYVPKVFMALLVLYIGFFIIKKVVNFFEKALKAKSIDESLAGFLCSLVTWVLKALLLVSVASMVGIATTSFVAIIGAAGLAIGLALQGSLANFAGGVLILIFKPFKTGDYIVAQGEEGFVKKIDVFATVLTKLDNQRVILANGPLGSGTIVNVGAEPQRRVDLSVGIDYSADVDVAFIALIKMCSEHSKVLSSPAPFIGITNYNDSSIDLTIRSWCNTADYWDVFFDLNKAIKPALDKVNIGIPFPQRDVHMIGKN